MPVTSRRRTASSTRSSSGDTAVVGAPAENGVPANADSPSLEDSGSAYVFARTDGGWTLQAHLTASDAAEFDHFGNSVAIRGDTIVVGAQFDNVGDNANQGSVYVFIRNGTAWTEQAHLTASDGTADDLFGNTVAIEGDTISVTVPQEVGAATQRPPYVFTRSGTVWAPQQTAQGPRYRRGFRDRLFWCHECQHQHRGRQAHRGHAPDASGRTRCDCSSVDR